jgi:putative transport protein
MSIALSIIVLSTVIALGKLLGRFKIFGISLGVTWILFVGIVFSHFGYMLDPGILHFMKEF